jgi:hypothetical protein
MESLVNITNKCIKNRELLRTEYHYGIKTLYHLLIVNNDKNIDLFFEYISTIKKVSEIEENIVMSIDFEFNTKIVALFQICFEVNDESMDRIIFFIYPPLFDENQTRHLIDILINKNIITVAHGSDSLDLPYVFEVLLMNKKKYIKAFLDNFVDTKFLCEYYNIEYEKTLKCKIYEFLLNHEIIDQNKYDELDRNEDEMGPIYNIKINIHELSRPLMIYSLYDVVFLKKLHDKFSKNEKFYDIIRETTRYILLSRRSLLTAYNKLNEIINSMNNYYVKYNNRVFRLSQLYNYFIEKIKNPQLIKLMKINYFKKIFTSSLKYILYYNISLTTTININSHNIFTEKINLFKMNEIIYPQLNRIFILYDKDCKKYSNKFKNIT